MIDVSSTKIELSDEQIKIIDERFGFVIIESEGDRRLWKQGDEKCIWKINGTDNPEEPSSESFLSALAEAINFDDDVIISIAELTESHDLNQDYYLLRDCEVIDISLESLLSAIKPRTFEKYKAVALSTGILSPSDHKILSYGTDGMIAERDTGYFIKLFEEYESNRSYFKRFSLALQAAILDAHQSGARMLELDRDARD